MNAFFVVDDHSISCACFASIYILIACLIEFRHVSICWLLAWL